MLRYVYQKQTETYYGFILDLKLALKYFLEIEKLIDSGGNTLMNMKYGLSPFLKPTTLKD